MRRKSIDARRYDKSRLIRRRRHKTIRSDWQEKHGRFTDGCWKGAHRLTSRWRHYQAGGRTPRRRTERSTGARLSVHRGGWAISIGLLAAAGARSGRRRASASHRRRRRRGRGAQRDAAADIAADDSSSSSSSGGGGNDDSGGGKRRSLWRPCYVKPYSRRTNLPEMTETSHSSELWTNVLISPLPLRDFITWTTVKIQDLLTDW